MNNNNEKGMTVIVKTITRLTLGFILLYGIYVALTGHLSPGGGFAGGVIVALSFVHIMLAFGKDVALRKLNARLLRLPIVLGALIFLYVVLGNFKVNGAAILMPMCEVAVVGGGLFAIFIALVLLSKTDKNAE